VDPVPDPLLLRKSGSAGNRTRTSGSVARNSGHRTTEAVFQTFYCTKFQGSTLQTTWRWLTSEVGGSTTLVLLTNWDSEMLMSSELSP
jgi:hypothetical protein